MLLSAMSASSLSVSGPAASYSLSTMRVVAGAVSMAMTPSNSATGQGLPTINIPRVTQTKASGASHNVTRMIPAPSARKREASKIDPMLNRMSPSATSLRKPSVARLSWLIQSRAAGPITSPTRR